MIKFVFNGQEFTGDKFEVKGGVLHIDGHAIADLREDTEYIEVKGGGTLICDKKVIINTGFGGTINAETVIVNGELLGATINAQKVIDNR